MEEFKAPEATHTTATPPGKKILKTMEASRKSFYLLKAKMSGAVPRLAGKSGEFIDLTDDKPGDQRDTIWQKLKKNGNSNAEGTSHADVKNEMGRGHEIPGAKLRILKDILEPKMREKRKEALQKRQELWKAEHETVKKNHHDAKTHDFSVVEEINDRVDIDEPELDDDNGDVFRHASSPNHYSAPKNGDGAEGNSMTGDDLGDDKPEESNGSIDHSKKYLNDEHFSCSNDSTTESAKNGHTSFAKPLPSRFNQSRSLDDFIFAGLMNQDRSPTCPRITLDNSVDNSTVDLDNISATRKLLGRVISEGDSQPPTSQDILNVCSGQFMLETNSSSRLNDPVDSESKASCSTPSSARAPRLFYDIFNATPRRLVPPVAPGSEKSTSAFEMTHQSGDLFESPMAEAVIHNKESAENQESETTRKKRNLVLSESEDDAEGGLSDNEEKEEPDDVEPEDDEDKDDDNEEEDVSDDDANHVEDGEEDEEEAYAQRERERRMYFDNEAALSGSDDDDGEEKEDDLDKDEWEPEAGDLDELPSENELRSQIGRIHWKQMMDEDKRKLLRYKEAYLHDGDGDSRAITYRFRWKRNGSEDDNDDFGNDGRLHEESGAPGDEEADEGWQDSLRQRAKWLSKHGVSVEDALADVDVAVKDSQFFNAAKAALHRAESLSNDTGSSHAHSMPMIPHGLALLHQSVSVDSGAPAMFFRRESLLKRGNSLLEKLVGESGNSGGAVRKKAAAVFTVLSPKKDQLDDSRGEKRMADSEPLVPNAKKRKLFDEGVKSIFQTLD